VLAVRYNVARETTTPSRQGDPRRADLRAFVEEPADLRQRRHRLAGVNGIGIYGDSVNGVRSSASTNWARSPAERAGARQRGPARCGPAAWQHRRRQRVRITFSNNTGYLRDLAGKYFYYRGLQPGKPGRRRRLTEFYQWIGGPPPSTTALASSLNPSGTGARVTFTATVTGSAPTGRVAFTADGTTLTGCATVALPAGTANSKTATCSTTTLTAGTHSIVASYMGDATNRGSTSAALSQVVSSKTATTTSLASSANIDGRRQRHLHRNGHRQRSDRQRGLRRRRHHAQRRAPSRCLPTVD
jgi:hypothetical protein